MILSTTPTIEGKKITKYVSLVHGDTIMGVNIFKDLFAGIRDIVGGRSATYEKELKNAKALAIKEMVETAEGLGAHAIVGIDYDYETVGANGSMLMINVTGTAVELE